MKTVITAVALLASGCSSIPTKGECTVARHATSPLTQGVTQGLMVGGAANPYAVIVGLTTATLRNQQCVKADQQKKEDELKQVEQGEEIVAAKGGSGD